MTRVEVNFNIMKWNPTFLLFFILIIFIECNPPGDQSKSTKPNIIIIFTDDLGYGDLGIYGHPTINTPNLNKMAMEGLKFTQFYTGASVCTPSRAALLTGRLPVRYGMVSDQTRVLFPFSYGGLPKDEYTIAESLKERGYTTAMIGKWHLGHLPEHLPVNHGFDYYFGIPYSNDMMGDSTSNWKPKKRFPPIPLIENTEIIESGIDQTNLTKRYIEKAIEYIRTNRDNPFFLYFPHTFPHIPLFASDDFLGKSTAGIYGDVVEEIDWSVGQILNTLRDEGLDNNTFVFFTSDNGPWLVMEERGGSAGLLREGKGSTWEGGMRVPAIAWWPGKIEGGRTTQALSTTMDVGITAMSLAGSELYKERISDGTNLSPILFGTTDSVRNEIYYYLGEQLFGVRSGPWKIHFKTLTPYVGEKPVDHDPPLLFNLNIDPSEEKNVAASYPEVVMRLKKIAEDHLKGVEKKPSILENIDRSYFE